MLTYNGEPIPETIRTDRIVSAFCNPVNPDTVLEYANMLQWSEPPPIMGYPSILDWSNVGDHFISGEEITEDHEGERIWYVTDGHHRAYAAIEAGKPWLRVEIDPSAFTIYEELEAWRLSV